MMILKVCDILLSKYQVHIFVVILYYAYMQFKMNKKLEVQTHICGGKFVLLDYKYSALEKSLKELKEKDVREKEAKQNNGNGIGRQAELFNG